VQLAIGIPTAFFGVALLVLAAVLHHDYSVLSIALGELGAVLLSLSILHLLYERLLREEYNRETIDILRHEIYPKFEAFAPLADANKLGLSAVKEDFDMAEIFRRIRHETKHSLVIVGGWMAWNEHFQQGFVDLVNRGGTVDVFVIGDAALASQRREDVTGEQNLGPSLIEGAKTFFVNTRSKIDEKYRGNLRLWGYQSLPGVFLFQFDETLTFAGWFPHGRNAEEGVRFEVRDPTSLMGRFFQQEIAELRKQSTPIV